MRRETAFSLDEAVEANAIETDRFRQQQQLMQSMGNDSKLCLNTIQGKDFITDHKGFFFFFLGLNFLLFNLLFWTMQVLYVWEINWIMLRQDVVKYNLLFVLCNKNNFQLCLLWLPIEPGGENTIQTICVRFVWFTSEVLSSERTLHRVCSTIDSAIVCRYTSFACRVVWATKVRAASLRGVHAGQCARRCVAPPLSLSIDVCLLFFHIYIFL